MAFSKTYWQISNDEISFYRLNISLNAKFQPFLNKEALRVTMREADDRFVVMCHYRTLLKRYYEIGEEQIHEILFLDSVSETQRYILDNETNQPKPTYKELCLLYLNVVDSGDDVTSERLLGRFEKHRKAGIFFKRCPGFYIYRLFIFTTFQKVCYFEEKLEHFRILLPCGHLLCRDCVGQLTFMTGRASIGIFDCPICTSSVEKSNRIFLN